MLVGQDAQSSLHAAKTVLRFRELEAQGKVRIVAEPEQENYFDVYGKPDDEKEYQNLCDTIERMGCWYVHVDVFDGCPVCDRGSWETADSIGMCVYDNPCSPYENCYVIDLMAEAIKRVDDE
jgi:hypothetical protein